MDSKYRAYSEYRHSGLQWLGQMPTHWSLRKSKYIFSKVQREVRPDDGVITAFRDGQVTLRTNRRVEGFTEAIKEIGYQGVRKGDLLVHAMDGFAGAIGVSDSDGKCSPVCSVCVPVKKNEIFIKYFGYLVRQLAVTDFISSLAKGIRERSTEFRYSEFSALELALPPVNEQEKIANFLDHETAKIDTLIEKQQQLIALLKEKRQAVISHAVTKGLNPNSKMKDSGVEWLGEVPEHWHIGKCGFYLSILSGFAFPSSGFSDDESDTKLLRGINVGVSQLKWIDTVYWRRKPGDALDAYEMKAGDIVIGMDRPLISEGIRVAKVKDVDLPCLLLQRVASLKSGSMLNADYLFSFISSEMFSAHISPDTTGVSVPHISPDQINNFKIAIPPIKEQETIAEFLSSETSKLDKLIDRSKLAIEFMQERRTSLISAAVTGKIDVRDWVAPVPDQMSKEVTA